MAGTMDMKQLMNISNMMENMYDEQKHQEREPNIILSCYGCEHLCASPLGCDHPNTMVVRWDPIRNESYRMPSIKLAVENGGVCKFFDPDAERGAGGWLKKKQKDRVTKIDSVLDQIDDDDIPIEEFLKNLEKLDDELSEEDGEKKEGDEEDDK